MLRAVSRLRSVVRFMILLMIPVLSLAMEAKLPVSNFPEVFSISGLEKVNEPKAGSLPFRTGDNSEQWAAYTNPYNFQSFLEDGQYLWFSSPFGVYRYDRNEGSSTLFNTATCGINSNFVSDIAKDAGGNYWFSHMNFATDSDLCGGISILHTDGSWSVMNYEDVPFSSNNLTCLEFDSQGKLWVGSAMNGYSQGGLSCYDPINGQWTHYNKDNSNLPSNTVMSITKVSDGSLWLCFSGDVDPDPYVGGGLLHITSSGWTVFNTQIADSDQVTLKDWYIKNLVEDSQGNLWFGLSGSVSYGLFRYDGSSFSRYLYPEIASYWDVSIDSQDRIYINTISSGILTYQNDAWEILGDPENMVTDRYLQNTFMESNDRLWIALYDDGLINWQNGIFLHASLNPDIALKSMNSFWDICSSPTGEMYFGTGWYVWGDLPRSRSLIKLSANEWQGFGYSDYQNYVVNDICFDSQGSLYIATGDANADAAETFEMYGSVCKYTPDGWIKYDNPTTAYPFVYASSASIDGNGDVWAGTRTEGLAVYHNSSWQTYNTGNCPSIFSDTILDLLAQPAQNLMWIATTAGLYKVETEDPENFIWTHYSPSNSSLPSWQVNCMVLDNNGRLWVGTSSGAVRLDTGVWNQYPELSSVGINSICVDELQGVWFGTEDQGLIRFYNGSFIYYNRGNSPLPAHRIMNVASDHQGHLWINPFNNGLYCLSYGSSAQDDSVEPVLVSSIRNYPNPFNPSTTISFELPVSGDTEVKIYNCRGQVVKTFAPGLLTKGSHKLPWDGYDDHKNPCASGVYLVSVKNKGCLLSHKMTLVK